MGKRCVLNDKKARIQGSCRCVKGTCLAVRGRFAKTRPETVVAYAQSEVHRGSACWPFMLLRRMQLLCSSIIFWPCVQGYPGSLTTTVTYRLVDQSLKLTIDADTDKATPVNITQHRYRSMAATSAVCW